jgi:hypothetical protein
MKAFIGLLMWPSSFLFCDTTPAIDDIDENGDPDE